MTDIVDRLNQGPPGINVMRDGAQEIMDLRAEREALRYRATKVEALYQRTVAVLMAIYHLLPPGPVKGDDGGTYILDLNNPLWMDAYQQLGDRIRAIPAEIEKAKAEQGNGGGGV